MAGLLTPEEVEARVTGRHIVEWQAYFKVKAEYEKKAVDAAKKG